MITGKAMVAGVIGWPVAHSLSPLIHNAWIEALGLDAVYVPFLVHPDGLQEFVRGLKSAGNVPGMNVTLPHKGEFGDYCLYERTDAMHEAEAANLILFQEGGKVLADNTDGVGLLSAFAEQAPDWRACAGPVTLLGAGGAAQGAIAALLAAGVPEVRIAARSPLRAGNVAYAARSVAPIFSFYQLHEALNDVTAVINATSAGLNGVGELPAMDAAPPGAVFMDMVYKPLRTKFLRDAEARGHPTVDGLAMLIGQARPSFEAFFGVPPPPVEVVDVRALCLNALGEAA